VRGVSGHPGTAPTGGPPSSGRTQVDLTRRFLAGPGRPTHLAGFINPHEKASIAWATVTRTYLVDDHGGSEDKVENVLLALDGISQSGR